MSNLSLYEELFQQGIITPSWDNIDHGFTTNVADDIIIEFFSKNINELLVEKFEGTESFNQKIIEILYKNIEIDLDIYRKLTKYFNFEFEEIFEDFPSERASILIVNKCLNISESSVNELVKRIESERNEDSIIQDSVVVTLLIDLFYIKADPNFEVDNVEIFIDSVLKKNFKEDIKLFLVEEYYSRVSDENKNKAVEILFKDEDSKINYAIKDKIIDTQDFVLDDLSVLKDVHFRSSDGFYTIFTNLVVKNKISPRWSNLVEYIKHPMNDSVLSDFINRNIDLLNKDTFDENEDKTFINDYILHNSLLDDDVYMQLIDKIDPNEFESIKLDLSWEKIKYLSEKSLLSLKCIELIYQKRDGDSTEDGGEIAEDIILSIIESHSEGDELETHETWQYLNYKNIPQYKLITKFFSSKINNGKELVFKAVSNNYQNNQITEDFSQLYPVKKADVIKLANLLESDTNRLQILIYYYEILKKEDLIKVFEFFKDEKYQQLAPDWDKRPKLEVNALNRKILEKMVESGYLSETSLDNKGGEYHIRKLIS